MKKCYLLTVIVTISLVSGITPKAASQCTPAATGNTPTSEYTLVWEENFDTDGAVCSDNWFHQTQPITDNGTNWANGELQHYTNSINNSIVEGGKLKIIAISQPGYTQDVQDDAGNTITVAKDYTSARLNSKFAFTYGKVEVRAKLPAESGTWPAIWTLGQNINERGAYWQTQGMGTTSWPQTGEIDIMEQFDDKTIVKAATHTPASSGGTTNQGQTAVANTNTEWHSYTIEWDADKVEFSVDGNDPYYTYDPLATYGSKITDPNDPNMNWPFDEPQFLLLNLALGGVVATPAPSFTTATMEVDYVKIYQKSQAPPEPVVSAPAPPAREAEDVVSIFSDAYADVAISEINPFWGQSGTVDIIDIESNSNSTLKYSNFNYQGTQLDGNNDVSAMEYVHIDMWTADATVVQFSPISVSTGELLVSLTPIAAGQWNSYDIPLSEFTGLTFTDIHQMKFDGQAGTNPSNIYLDNIYFYKEPVAPATEPVVSAPAPPARETEDVVSIFSDAYTDVAISEINPFWGQSGTVDIIDIESNSTLKYSNFNYQGTQLDGNNDVSAMEYVHIDMWTADATVVQFSPISVSTGELLVSLTPIATGQWNSYDIPLSEFTGLTFTDIHQMKFDGQAGTNPSNIYLDNIYFYKEPVAPATEPVVSAPAPPARETEDVVSIFSDAYTDVAISEINPFWGQSGTVDIIDIESNSNSTLKYANFNYQGTQFDGNNDVSAMEYVHIDMWTADATVVQFSPISVSTGELLVSLTPIAAGQWNSYDIPLSEFTGLTFTDIHQMKFDGQAGTNPSNIYLDNIYFYKEPVAPATEPVVSAPAPPARETEDVVSIFSDAYTDVAISEINPFWGQSGTVDIIDIESNSNSTLKYANFNYQGTQFDGNNDVSAMEYVHIDMWTADATVVQFSPISVSTGELLVSLTPIAAGQWNSYDIPLSEFTGLTFTDIHQMKFDGQAGTNPSNIYLDNIYFYKEPVAPATEPVVSAPAPPARETEDVVSIFSDAYTDVAISEINPFWGQSGTVDIIDIESNSNSTLKYSNFNYQGTQFDGNNDVSAMEYVHIDMWTADATVVQFSPISVSTGELLVSLTPIAAGQWNSYDIPLSEFTGLTFTDIHQMKFDGQAGTNPSSIYLDNIYFYKEPVAPATEPVVSAPAPPARETEDVVSIFSDAYTDVAIAEINPFWGQSGTVDILDIESNSNSTLKYSNFNYQGTQLDGNNDVSAMEFVHIDMWTADATVVQFSPISVSTGELLVSLTPIAAGQWNSYDIPLSEFTGLTFTDIHQMKFDGQAGTNPSNIYLDNIYFYRAPVVGGTDVSLSDLQLDGQTIDGFSANKLSYDVELAFGTTVVPTVTVTTTDSNASSEVTAATELPGTTTIDVISEDQSMSATYSVVFTIAPEFNEPQESAPTPEERNAADVVSIFSDAYTDVAIAEINPFWGQSGIVDILDIESNSNSTLKYSNFNYQGTQLDGNNDVSAMEFVHIDMWTADATVVQFSPISVSTGELLVSLTPIAAGQWNSYDIPLSEFTGLTFTDIHQMKFDGQAGTNPSNIYLDNIYFYRAPVVGGTDVSLSDLQLDGQTIDGFSANKLSYDVELAFGTTVVPTVTVTTTDSNASSEVTATTELPGTTTIDVISDNGSNSATYSIVFTIAPEFNEPQESAPTPEERNASDVVSIFSDAYTDVAIAEINPFWGQSGTVDIVDIESNSNSTLKYSNFNYQGTQLDGNNDVSAMEFVHIDMWTADATVVQFSPISVSTGELLVSLTPIAAGQWNSYDIPLSEFTGLTFTDIHQMKFDGQAGTNPSNIYLDNIYFYRAPVVGGTDVSLSDLQLDGQTIDGFSANKLSYDVELAFGTTVVPTVTVTTTDSNASSEVTAATELPGTTTIDVISEDQSMSATYSVVFTIAPEFNEPQESAPTPEERNAADVVSIFSDAYTDVAIAEINPFWGQSGIVDILDIESNSNSTLKYSNFNYQGTQLDGNNDVSAMEFVHIDMWTADATVVQFSPISVSTGELLVSLTPIAAGQWNSYDIPLSEFTGLTFTDIHQMKFDGQAGTNPSNIYLDNIYFYRAPVVGGTDVSLSDLQLDGQTIDGFSANKLSYDVELAFGTTVVPTVTVTTTDSNASSEVTATTELPGTTTIDVISDNGSNSATYSIVFTIAPEFNEPQESAPTPEERNASDVVSIFSDAYTDVAIAEINPFWGQSGTVDIVDIESNSNSTLKYSNFNYQGTQLDGNNDVSAMEYVHIDMWTADATVVQFSPISVSTGELLVSLTPIAAGQWNSYDIPLSEFTGLTFTDIHQMKFDGQTGTNPSNIYLDNIYFYRAPVEEGEDVSLSDLQLDGQTIDGFSANKLSYDVELAFGTTVVPTVTVTTTDSNASSEVTATTELPGTTTIDVISDNGSNSATYSVVFTIAPEFNEPQESAPTPEERNASDVVSIFSDAYTDVAIAEINPFWGQSGTVDIIDIESNSNSTLKYSNFNYQGTQLDGNNDVSAMEFVHIDMWTADATVVQFSPISVSTGELLVSLTPIAAGQWNSYDIPLSEFTGLTFTDIHQMKFDGQAGTNPSNIYLDNIYFYRAPVVGGTDVSLSDLQLDGQTIDGFSANKLSYDVELAFGTTVVPTVTVTTTDSNASSEVTAATELPGTTTIDVISEDQSMSATYSVVFTIAPEFNEPQESAPTPEERNAADVVSIFSDAYTDVAIAEINPFWGQSGTVDILDIESNSNSTLKYSNFNYQGTQLDGNNDVSAMEFVHIDMWTADATVVQFSPISVSTGELLVSLTPIAAGQWNSYDIPLSEFTGLTFTDIHQMKFDGQAGTNPSNIYLDNIYFYRAPVVGGTDVSLSDLQLDGQTIDGFSANKLSYDVELAFGTTVVPTVTVTTTDSNASSEVTATTELPGTTTIDVISDNGSNSATYSIVFTIAPEFNEPQESAPTPEERNASDVVSIFSDAYTDVAIAEINPFWGQSGTVDIVDIESNSNSTLKYSNFNYQGTQLDGNNDVSAMEYVHIDMWTADATVVQFSPISVSTGELLVSLTPIAAGQWNSYDIPLSEFTGLTFTDIHQMKFDGQTGTNPSNIYLDNIYFYRAPVEEGEDVSLSDLQLDGQTIDGFSANKLSYDVELAFGTTVVPTVTVTTTDSNASSEVTATTELPGTTTIDVISDNGSNSATYSVVFTIAPEFNEPQESAPTPEERNASDVVSIFSDAYTDVAIAEINPFWGQSGTVDIIDIESNSNSTLKYSNFNYQGTQLDGNNDVSAMEFVHIDMWTADATVVQFSPISVSTGELLVSLTPIAAGQWNSYDIPLSEFTGLAFTDIHQMKFDGQTGTNPSNIYLDNIYFYRSPVNPATDASLSDIKVDGTSIEGFSSNTFEYEVEYEVGTTDVPSVTATTTEQGATANVTQATALPGVTSINVTSEDQSNTATYSISFIEAGGPATELPYDFENSPLSGDIVDFDGGALTIIDNPQSGGINTSVKVGQMIKGAGAVWAGSKILMEDAIDFSVDKTWTMKVYAPAIGTKVLLKVENKDNAGIFHEVEVLTTVANEWEELTFDYSAVNTTNAFHNVVIIFDNGTEGDGSAAFTYLFDDIELGTSGPSEDATLNDLMVDGATVPDFLETMLDYSVALPFGTTVVPTVTASTTDANASLVITPAESLPGTTSIVVTAEDGTTTQTYTIDFTVTEVGADASLSDLSIDGTTVDGFISGLLNYSYELAFGTIEVPTVTAVSTEDGATVVVTAAESLPGTTTVDITSVDGSNTSTYLVEFILADPATDATLSVLQVDGETITTFSASTLEYLVELPFGTTDIPVITAGSTDLNATVEINNVTTLPGSTSIIVTAEDGTTMLTYTVAFMVELPSEDASLAAIVVDGEPIDDFSESALAYTLELPFGTSEYPIVSVITTDENATTVVNSDTVLPGTTTITVTAENGTSTQIYSITFTTAAEISNDATLKELKYNNTVIADFSAEIKSYSVVLPYGSDLPVVTAKATNRAATVSVEDITGIPGMATVTVTAQDGTTIETYSVEFSIEKFSISGMASDETGAAFSAGTVVAIQVENNSIVFSSELSSSGEYVFPAIEAGTYFVGIDPIDTDKYFTTYFGNKVLVDKAQKLVVRGNVSGVNIQMQLKPAEEDLLTGQATIKGRVIEAVQGGGRIDFGRVLTGTPIAGVSVFLVRVIDGQVMTEVVTDQNGDFTINGVPLGEYTLKFEVEGVQADLGDSTIVIDDAEDEVVLTAAVSADGVTIEIEDTITAIDPEDLFELNAYSHNGVLYVNSNQDLKHGRVELFTLSGHKILDKTLQQVKEEFIIKSSGIVVVRISDKMNTVILTKRLFAD